MGSIPGLERSPGKGNGTPLQYSCLENLMDRGVWQAAVHGITTSQTLLRMHACMHTRDVKLGVYLRCLFILYAALIA